MEPLDWKETTNFFIPLEEYAIYGKNKSRGFIVLDDLVFYDVSHM
ncbi:hypothetical protein MTBPR1_40211 [Candidatus Terasakiella magnetica]|uniref:Uncharacterized protein n=1 Tax=Candidatus Terasakiella magnetica TaxID=1867952 RepID=A0A1C3RIT7_9PROT|nr:hypothetical protein MTBPR1_40211 [Candidatus Terasakiella magnetica]